MVGFYGVATRAGTPQPIVDKVSREIAKILHSPDIASRFTLDGSEPVGNTSKEFTEYFKKEAKRYAALTKELGMRPE